MNIYIGFDSTNYGQQLAHDICKRSIERFCKIKINTLIRSDLINKKIYNRTDNTGATEFTYTRFLVPFLNNYNGWALFCDSDFLWLKDPTVLFEINYDQNIAVYCVKHDYTNCNNNIKMDGRQQEWYPRKNWSSLMLFNCSHPYVIRNLTPENINTKSPAWLHRMMWCEDSMIGNIDKKYNYLVGYYNNLDIKDIGALHFTDGGPWHLGYENVIYGDLWLNMLSDNETCKLFNDKCINCITK